MNELTEQIPDKLYFRIGEVAKIIGVEPYVLRYWETEFPEIAPVKSKSRQRLYKRQDVVLIQAIRDLLYKQNFTIKGARRKIKEVRRYQKDHPEQKQMNLVLKEVIQPQIDMQVLRDVLEEMDDFIHHQ